MVDMKLNTEDLLRLLFVRMDCKCYTIAAEQMAVEVAERVSFEAKWRLLARVGASCYILISNVSGAVKVAPLQILQFPVLLPHKFQDVEKFNLQFPDFSEITEMADKLDVSLGSLKQWEQNRKQIFKSTWEKYFKHSLESCG